MYLAIIMRWDQLYNQDYVITMGKCASGKTYYGKEEQLNAYKDLIDEREYHMLKLIYEDIGARDKSRTLTLENFLLFFHKNGYWGRQLFKEFDSSQSNSITEKQFIRGIVKIFKTSEEEKIELLFKFFSGGNYQKDGVPFKQFLTMLYNYPKQEIKNILNDEEFINKQIRGSLVGINEEFAGRRLDSVCNGNVGNFANAQFQFDDGDSGEDRLESKIGRDILKEMNQRNDDKGSMTLKLKVGKNDVEVRTASIHHIVKKFARTIFKEYGIDINNGTLKLQQFLDWMRKHKKLYNDYYGGFHGEIWQVSKTDHRPLFTEIEPQFCSRARTALASSSDRKVEITLIHSTLIVCDQADLQTPIQIICLEGLAVAPIFGEQDGHGIEISHREGVYRSHKFFFLNQDLQKRWMENLKYYKGSSISQMFEMGEKIGIGKFSVVYRCKEKCTGEQFAIKVIESFKLNEEEKLILAHESSIMSILSHPLLVFFKESIITKTHIYIVTELVKGKDLYELIRQYRCLDEPEAAYIIRQVMIGVRYLHSLGIAHRDLKPENIMVELDEKKNEMGRIKIIDFGFANYLTSIQELKDSNDRQIMKGILAGTPNYIAPELLRLAQGEDEPLSEKMDNFSIGSILYMMLSGGFAFNGANTEEILQRTLEGSYTINDKKWKCVSKNAKNLVVGLLENQPGDRISLDEALNHPWFSELQLDCKDRHLTSFPMAKMAVIQ